MAEQERKAGKGKYRVVGQVAVIGVLDGSERYLYKGARFDAAQADADAVKHLESIGLIEKVAERAPSAADKTAAAKVEAEKKAAAEKAEADAKAKADADAKAAEEAKAAEAAKAAAADKAAAAKGK